MSTPNNTVWLNGKLVPSHEAAINVYDHGLLYGDGVFEGIRIYNNRIFKARTHLRRLFESAKAIRMDIPFSTEDLYNAMRQTLDANKRTDGYIRLCVTRGVGSLGLNPFTCKTPSVFIISDAIALYPRETYENGLAVITSSVMRNHPAALSPRIKSLNYLNNILAKIEAIDAGVLEAVMLNSQGLVAECTGDNIFIVRKFSGTTVLATPPLHAGILEGVTMSTVMDLARAAGIEVRSYDMTKHDLYTADEMFLTGTAAEVVPVTRIDGRTLGDGTIGQVTRKLLDAFRAVVKANAPED
ncbi:MAG: branched-chain-amino-acid transaminase [Phycisphaera sp.]|nr:branched-chain-amino-acid transaminase [Phycisphaera sp.]